MSPSLSSLSGIKPVSLLVFSSFYCSIKNTEQCFFPEHLVIGWRMAESTFEGITWPDYLVIALYFIFVLVVGLIVSKGGKRKPWSSVFENPYFQSSTQFLFAVIMEKQEGLHRWILPRLQKYAFHTGRSPPNSKGYCYDRYIFGGHTIEFFTVLAS